MKENILHALRNITLADGTALPDSPMLSDVIVREDAIAFTLNAGADMPAAENIKQQCETALVPLLNGRKCLIALTSEQAAAPETFPLIAIASGKGGVGKSTLTTNIAAALTLLSIKPGIIDADIYGPSQPQLLGIDKKPEVFNRILQPIISHQIACLSMGMLVPEESALIWRGPMISKVLEQLFVQANWHGCDVLLADMPPGTGDVPLTIAKQYGLSGALLVTLPNETAWADVKKAVSMFRKLNTPIMGVINNMAYLEDAQGEKLYAYGNMNVQKACQLLEVPFWGDIPMTPEVNHANSSGYPYVLSHPESSTAQAYKNITAQLVAYLESKT